MPASYPTSAKTFATITNTTTSDASQINEPREEITAIEQDLIAGLPVARGGTGLTSFTIGDIPYASASGTLAKLADVATGQVLVSGGVATAPAYSASPTLTALTAGTLTSTGQVVISGASAGQVVFPATQNPSTNANTLDDYKEGDWTPTIGGSGGQSGQVYSVQVGKYVKVGKLVTCQARVTLSTLGTITGNVQIQGLPFTAENTSGLVSIAVINWTAMTTALVYCCGVVTANGTAIVVVGVAAAGVSLGNFTQADLSNTTSFDVTVSYRATA